MENEKEFQNENETDCILQRKSPLNLDNCSTKEWQSETKYSFHQIENTQEQIGKRRQLLRKYFELQAAKEIQDEEFEDVQFSATSCTEYIEKFCDSHFKPLLESDNFDTKIQMKYPLYGGMAHSLYKEQVEKGYLKEHLSVYNFKQPFRKSNSFTMPPELSLREIDT